MATLEWWHLADCKVHKLLYLQLIEAAMPEWGQKAKAALSNLAYAPPHSHVFIVFYILSVLGPPGITSYPSLNRNLCARPRTQMAESKPDPIAQSLSGTIFLLILILIPFLVLGLIFSLFGNENMQR
jgi:hypothetical protein